MASPSTSDHHSNDNPAAEEDIDMSAAHSDSAIVVDESSSGGSESGDRPYLVHEPQHAHASRAIMASSIPDTPLSASDPYTHRLGGPRKSLERADPCELTAQPPLERFTSTLVLTGTRYQKADAETGTAAHHVDTSTTNFSNDSQGANIVVEGPIHRPYSSNDGESGRIERDHLVPAFTDPFSVVFELENPDTIKLAPGETYTSFCLDRRLKPTSVSCRIFEGTLETPYDVTKRSLPAGQRPLATGNPDDVLVRSDVTCHLTPLITSIKLPETSDKTLEEFKKDDVFASIYSLEGKVWFTPEYGRLQSQMGGPHCTELPTLELALSVETTDVDGNHTEFSAITPSTSMTIMFELLPEKTVVRSHEEGRRSELVARLSADFGERCFRYPECSFKVEGQIPKHLQHISVADSREKEW